MGDDLGIIDTNRCAEPDCQRRAGHKGFHYKIDKEPSVFRLIEWDDETGLFTETEL